MIPYEKFPVIPAGFVGVDFDCEQAAVIESDWQFASNECRADWKKTKRAGEKVYEAPFNDRTTLYIKPLPVACAPVPAGYELVDPAVEPDAIIGGGWKFKRKNRGESWLNTIMPGARAYPSELVYIRPISPEQAKKTAPVIPDGYQLVDAEKDRDLKVERSWKFWMNGEWKNTINGGRNYGSLFTSQRGGAFTYIRPVEESFDNWYAKLAKNPGWALLLREKLRFDL